jgi:ATP-dependent DNA ligase
MLPQLANTYNPTKVYLNSQWLASPKLDGIRCLYYSPKRGLTSRSQKLRYVGFEEIETNCQILCADNQLSFLDGELYIPGEKFDVISGIVRDTKDYDVAAKARVEFRIFAVGSITNPNMDAGAMLDLMEATLPTLGRVVHLNHSIIPNTPIAIQAETESVKTSSRSDEGIMLRNPSSVYAGGRSNNLLKVKNFVRSNFVIVGFGKGTGKFANSLGNLLVRSLIDGMVVMGKVGTGFSDEERSNIWANQSNYLGRDIEVIYLGITPAKKSLRHPIFSRFV